jgi:hypothetical protein
MRVVTVVEIDENIEEYEGFRHVQISRRIITLHSMFWCIMIYSFRHSLTLPFM